MLPFTLLLALTSAFAAASRPPLRLTQSNTFKIAAFSDLHYGEDEDSFGVIQDVNSARLMNHVLDTEDPDFVVLNGDLITGENTFAFNSSRYVDSIVKPLVDRGYKWASTYGNHDSKFNLSREDILREEQKYKGAYTQHGPNGTDGVTNYMLPVYPYTTPTTTSAVEVNDEQSPILHNFHFTSKPSSKPIALLYFLDSRGGSEHLPSDIDNIPNFVSARTASWFRSSTITAKQEWGVVPSLAFMHIPINAFKDLQQKASGAHGVGGQHFPGLNADKPLEQQGSSAESGNVYMGQDMPFMQALLETEGLHSIFSGHDHGDSWCGLWPDDSLEDPSSSGRHSGSTSMSRSGEGHQHINRRGDGSDNYASNGRPFLCFCKHSGFGGYGRWNRGVRQIELRFSKDGAMGVETWDRMQEGSDHTQVVTRVALNSTYGEDVYSVDDGGYLPSA